MSSGWQALAKKEAPKRGKEDFFKARDTLTKKGIKVGVYGKWETGKTHFALTFPEPIHVIDTEFGCSPLLRKELFRDKEIYVFEAASLDPLTDRVDPLKSLENVEEAIATLADVKEGTIVIDTGTDIWGWIIAWLEEIATRKTDTGAPYRFEYGKANLRYRNLIIRLIAKPVHFVITAQTAEVFDSTGTPTGVYSPRWMKQTPHWVDLLIYMDKKHLGGTWKYVATIEKCRWERAFNLTVEDLDFQKMKSALEEKLGITIE